MVLPFDACSMIQNASRVALPRVALPYTTQNFHLSRLLLSSGLITSLTLGSPSSPAPQEFPALPVPQRRLWLDLKYRQDQPVLRRLASVSKPSRSVYLDADELRRWVNGAREKGVPGLNFGEIGFVKTEGKGWMEGREAVKLRQGAQVIARAS